MRGLEQETAHVFGAGRDEAALIGRPSPDDAGHLRQVGCPWLACHLRRDEARIPDRRAAEPRRERQPLGADHVLGKIRPIVDAEMEAAAEPLVDGQRDLARGRADPSADRRWLTVARNWTDAEHGYSVFGLTATQR